MAEGLRLLAHLHRGGTYAYLWVLPDRRSYWSAAAELPPPPAGKLDVYFGVHPTTQIPPANSRGEAAQPERVRAQVPYIACINCLFAEFDAVQFLNDKDRVLSHIGGLAQRPSVVIDSGGGYHAYWLLGETFFLDSPDARERAMRIQAAWVEHVGGDAGAKDLARVLRLPGTLNHKYKPPRPVQVVRSNFDRLYELGELARACRAGRPRPKPLSRPDPGALEQLAAEADAPERSPGAQTPSDQTVAEAQAALARLARWRCDDYDAWVHVGMALSELGAAGLRLWDAWSRGSPKYRERDCNGKWATFRPREGLTLASLTYWANQDSPAPPPALSPFSPEAPGILRWDGRRGERAFLQGKEVRYAVAPEGRLWRVRARGGAPRPVVEVLLPRNDDESSPAVRVSALSDSWEEPARQIAVALNANMEQVRRELGEIPLQLAAHPPGAEAPPPSDPKTLSDFAPWVAGRLGGRGSREDKAEVGRATAAWLLRQRCFCQAKTSPLVHRKRAHLGHKGSGVIIENEPI